MVLSACTMMYQKKDNQGVTHGAIGQTSRLCDNFTQNRCANQGRLRSIFEVEAGMPLLQVYLLCAVVPKE